MTNRRDLLKFFGAGALIKPVSWAEPIVGELIKPAEVRLVPERSIVLPGKILGATLTIETSNGPLHLNLSVKVDGEQLLAKDDIVYADVTLERLEDGTSPSNFVRVFRAQGSGPLR